MYIPIANSQSRSGGSGDKPLAIWMPFKVRSICTLEISYLLSFANIPNLDGARRLPKPPSTMRLPNGLK